MGEGPAFPAAARALPNWLRPDPRFVAPGEGAAPCAT